jgi:hypothetical protein
MLKSQKEGAIKMRRTARVGGRGGEREGGDDARIIAKRSRMERADAREIVQQIN